MGGGGRGGRGSGVAVRSRGPAPVQEPPPPPPETVTVALSVSEPPGPVHWSVYVDVEPGETDTLPEVAPPVEKPPPVHEVASEEDQVRVEESPEAMVVGDAVRLAEGAEAPAVMVTVVQGPQLSPSFDSLIEPDQDVLLSAQRRAV